MSKLTVLTVLLIFTPIFAACSTNSTAFGNISLANHMLNDKNQKQANTKKHSSHKKDKFKKPAKVTAKEFKQIHSGMTYKQVVEMIGSKGKLTSKIGKKGTDLYTVMYSWDGEGGLGANVSMTFQGGKLINKSQFGLTHQSSLTAAITLKSYKQLEKGMSCKKVESIVGGKGYVQGVSGKKGTQFYTRIIFYKGKPTGSDALLTFQGGKLISKTEIGLK